MATANNATKSDVLVSVQFDLEKETKGAVRYQERGHAPLIGTLYVRKNAFATADYPKVVNVCVTIAK